MFRDPTRGNQPVTGPILHAETGERNARARSSTKSMQTPAARLPAAIGAALAECALLPLPPTLRAALAELLRCVSATDPARPIRVSVAHLMARMSRSRNTVSRYLAALTAAGLIERWQSTRGARRWGFKCAHMRLTPAALDLLGLQRAPSAVCVPNPVSQGEAAWRRVRRIPSDLADLAARIGAPRVVWLMSECRKRGRRLQEMSAAALQAASPAGFILRALQGRNSAAAPPAASAAAGGDSRRDARDVLREIDAGPRTDAGRRAGLAMLRAVRR